MPQLVIRNSNNIVICTIELLDIKKFAEVYHAVVTMYPQHKNIKEWCLTAIFDDICYSGLSNRNIERINNELVSMYPHAKIVFDVVLPITTNPAPLSNEVRFDSQDDIIVIDDQSDQSDNDMTTLSQSSSDDSTLSDMSDDTSSMDEESDNETITPESILSVPTIDMFTVPYENDVMLGQFLPKIRSTFDTQIVDLSYFPVRVRSKGLAVMLSALYADVVHFKTTPVSTVSSGAFYGETVHGSFDVPNGHLTTFIELAFFSLVVGCRPVIYCNPTKYSPSFQDFKDQLADYIHLLVVSAKQLGVPEQYGHALVNVTLDAPNDDNGYILYLQTDSSEEEHNKVSMLDEPIIFIKCASIQDRTRSFVSKFARKMASQSEMTFVLITI